MNDEKANLVPTSPVEWEEAFESSSSNVTLQQCHRLLEVAHLRYLLRILPANSSVLEAGCGPGKYVYAFAFMGHKCIGLDFSYKILLQARKRAVDLPKLRARTDWIHGTILNLPIGPEMLDCHASFGVLEHFTKPQQKAILSEAYRVLKPGGLLYLYVPNFWSAWTVRRQIRYWFRRMAPPHLVWQRNIRRSVLLKMCSEAGFDTEYIRSFDASGAFESLAPPSFLTRIVPTPMRVISTRATAKLALWCDDQDILGYGLAYIGRRRFQQGKYS